MVDVTIIIPVKNEEKNLPYCLDPIRGWAKEILVVDSNSTDRTDEIATSYGAKVIQFDYQGGWPKKRQFILDTYSFETEWILLLDCDEILTDKAKNEIEEAIQSKEYNGFYLFFKMEFFGKMLKHADPGLRKLSLFRTGKGGYEMRLQEQTEIMGDMEVHEHVIVDGKVKNLSSPILHRNYNSMSRFIIKHDEYSNYEALVHVGGTDAQMKASFWGTTEQRRRYLKKHLIRNPWSPFSYFIYMFVFRGGFLDGRAGFFYILYQCIYLYFVSAKIYEFEIANKQLNEK